MIAEAPEALMLAVVRARDESDRWREHAADDCGALRRVWHSLAELERMSALLRRELPNGATSRVVADSVDLAIREVRAAVLGQRGIWTRTGERDGQAAASTG